MLAFLNYRGVLVTLNVNFVVTALAYASIVILFFSREPWNRAHAEAWGARQRAESLPYGWIGVIASFQFAIWYYLGIEGTTQAAEEVRSPARSLPYGTMAGIITLLHRRRAHLVRLRGLLPWQYLGIGSIPLWDAAKMTGSPILDFLLFWGTSCRRSPRQTAASTMRRARGSPRARPLSTGLVRRRASEVSDAVPLDPVPDPDCARIRVHRCRSAQVITFSILSGLLNYTFMPINIWMFRKKWPLGSIRRGYTNIRSIRSQRSRCSYCMHYFLCRLSGLRLAAERDGGLLLSSSRCGSTSAATSIVRRGRSVHHALGQDRRVTEATTSEYGPFARTGHTVSWRICGAQFSDLSPPLGLVAISYRNSSRPDERIKRPPERLFGAARAMFDELYLEATGSIRISAACGTLSRL